MGGDGQVGLEFLLILSSLMILLAAFTLPLYLEAKEGAREASSLAEARDAAGRIAAAVNAVYAGGPGASQEVLVWLPRGVVGLSVGGYDHLEVDGVTARDGEVARDG
ncbi:MAG: hypothetical protein DSO04_06505, partial [Hadesarchaea archaeon]